MKPLLERISEQVDSETLDRINELLIVAVSLRSFINTECDEVSISEIDWAKRADRILKEFGE